MPADAFQKRLCAAMETGNLRVADLARWFGRRHSTIRGWVVDGRQPAGTPADVRDLTARLAELETMTRAKRMSGQVLRAAIAGQ